MPARLRVLCAVLALCAVTLMLLDAGPAERPALTALRRGADAALGPVHRAVGGGVASAGNAVARVGRLADAGEDEERLRRENDELRRALLERDDVAATGRSLAALLRLQETGGWTAVPARVVGVGPVAPFADTVLLDVGTDDGVREGQTVTAGRGLVGRTVRVGPTTTTAVLLTDPAFGVSVRLAGAPRSFGLVDGAEDGTVRLRLVEAAGARVRPGDDLVTAGSAAFVAGVPVGRVTRVDPGGDRARTTAVVAPHVDLGGLDLVHVVTEGPRRPPRAPAPPPSR